MRQCPRCNRSYPDQTLIYCLDDGSPLIPYTPAPTLQRPAARPTAPLATEFLPATQPTLLRERKNPWLLYAAVALLSVGLLVGVVLFIVSRGADTQPRELAAASPTPQAAVNSSQGEAPGSTQANRGETTEDGAPEAKEDEGGKRETATSNTGSDGGGAPTPSPVPQSPSWRLVGVWRANISAEGGSIQVTYTFNADGTSKFVARDRRGRRATGQGTWQYSEGMLYQTFANGANGKGSVEWLDDDTFEVTIIDNGVPADSGQKRRYHRLR